MICDLLSASYTSAKADCLYRHRVPDQGSYPVVFDFGIHKLLIPKNEYSSYFLPNESEIDSINTNKIKTNIMNYGITLLKMYAGNNISMKGKEIVLSEDISLSDDFKIFLGKCLTRNPIKRASWEEIQNCNFVKDDNNEEKNQSDKKLLIDDEKLKKIFNYLNDKFELIIIIFNFQIIEKNIIIIFL